MSDLPEELLQVPFIGSARQQIDSVACGPRRCHECARLGKLWQVAAGKAWNAWAIQHEKIHMMTISEHEANQRRFLTIPIDNATTFSGFASQSGGKFEFTSHASSLEPLLNLRDIRGLEGGVLMPLHRVGDHRLAERVELRRTCGTDPPGGKP